MRLNFALLRERTNPGVGRVGGVGSSVHASESAHTSLSPGVGGVGNYPARPDTPHLPTPAKRDRWGDSANGYALPTPPTPPTPEKQHSGSGGSIAAPRPAPDLPSQDCDGWAEDFGRWAGAHCVFPDGCLGGVAALGRNFSAWCAERGEAGPWPATFAALLREEGFTLTERGMVNGLLLRKDWEAAQPPPVQPEQLPTFTGIGATREGNPA